MDVSIIIPNFNGKELLQKNLPFVISAYKNKHNKIKEIIVVDDASTDDSVSFLKEEYFKEIKIIKQEKNHGFAYTVNNGVKTAKSDLVCLINSDVHVTSNFLETINKDFDDEQVFAVSLHEKGFGYTKGKFKKGFIIHEGMPEAKDITESFWASGGSGVFRKNVWNSLNGLDSELMPFYFEDLDISYRAQKRGYKILWDPKANVIHNHESTYKKLNQGYVNRIKERNYLLFNWKNLTSKTLIRKHIISLITRIIRHPGYLIVFFMAVLKLDVVMERRKIEFKETIISDEAIFEKFN